MADEYAWRDRDTIISLVKGFKRCLDDFMVLVQEAGNFKRGVLDHPGRVAELKKILDIGGISFEDKTWTIEDIQAKCEEIRTIYDYLTTPKEE